MARNDDTPISRAHKRRKELQDSVRAMMQEIEKIDEFIRVYREFDAGQDVLPIGGTPHTEPDNIYPPVVRGSGIPQADFDFMLRDILTEAKRPMQSAEIGAEFRRRGRPISATNEMKMAWNKMWDAKTRGVVVNLPGLGYWLAGEQLPPGAADAAKQAQSARRKDTRKATTKRLEWKGRPRGRPRVAALALSQDEIEAAKTMLIGNQKSTDEICQHFGVSLTVLKRYFPGGRTALRKQYPELAAQNAPRPPRKKTGGGPRGPRPSSAILETAAQMYQRGASVDEIVPVVGVSRSKIYRHLKSLGILLNHKPGPKS